MLIAVGMVESTSKCKIIIFFCRTRILTGLTPGIAIIMALNKDNVVDVNTDDRVAGTDGCGVVSRMREANMPSIDLGVAFGAIVDGRFIAE